LFLGNLNAKRDWGHARDFVDGMWRMLQQPQPDDYVLATGELHSVREFVELAFEKVGRRIVWRGKGNEEIGIEEKTGKDLVRVDPCYYRATEVDELLGDPTKARSKLGWSHKTNFSDLVAEMVTSDLEAVANDAGRKDRTAS
jgi:GDPmannose 4,6-dehydratase